MKDIRFYVCPKCGNLITAASEATVICCGIELSASVLRKAEEDEKLTVEMIENDYYVTSSHEMKKEHYLSFVALLTGDSMILRRCYPEWDLQARLPNLGHGMLVWHCTRHGLMYQTV